MVDRVQRAMVDRVQRAMEDRVQRAMVNRVQRAMVDRVQRALVDRVQRAMMERGPWAWWKGFSGRVSTQAQRHGRAGWMAGRVGFTLEAGASGEG